MKLLFLSMHYRPEPCDTRTSQLAKAFVRRGHRVTALTSFPNYPFGEIYPGYRQRPWSKENDDGVNLVRVPMMPDHSTSAKKRAISYLSFGASAAFIGSIVTRRPDLIWIHHPPLGTGLAGCFLAALKRVPYVYEVHDLWPETLTSTGMIREGRLTRSIRKVCNFLYRRSAAVVVTSLGMKKYLQAQGLPPEKVHVMPQWADETAFARVPRCESFGEKHGLIGKFNVLFTGNIGVAQRLETVLEAAKQISDLPDVQIIFVGAGLELERLKAATQEEGIANVRFLGQFSPETMPHFFAWADGLLVHLKDDPLFAITIPSKLQVYMAAGRPILCGVGGDAADMVTEHAAGICFSPENPHAMASAIRRLRQMTTAEREEMGARAEAGYSSTCSQEALVPAYDALFKQLVAKRKFGVVSADTDTTDLELDRGLHDAA